MGHEVEERQIRKAVKDDKCHVTSCERSRRPHAIVFTFFSLLSSYELHSHFRFELASHIRWANSGDQVAFHRGDPFIFNEQSRRLKKLVPVWRGQSGVKGRHFGLKIV